MQDAAVLLFMYVRDGVRETSVGGVNGEEVFCHLFVFYMYNKNIYFYF